MTWSAEGKNAKNKRFSFVGLLFYGEFITGASEEVLKAVEDRIVCKNVSMFVVGNVTAFVLILRRVFRFSVELVYEIEIRQFWI